MKTAVHFGAGKIGRGFIADLLHDSGYKIVFADVVQPLVDLVNETHEYSLFLIDHDYEEKVIDQVEAYSTITQEDKVIEAISEAEVLTTSVMATNLPKVAVEQAANIPVPNDHKRTKSKSQSRSGKETCCYGL
mgnify:CR=1 FL=1